MNPSMLVVGHGTTREAGARAFLSFVDRLRRGAGGAHDVAGGFIELASPRLADAVGALYHRGGRHLVAVPMVLIAAGHGKSDIPELLRDEAALRPDLSFSYGRPLGPHPSLLSPLLARIDAALSPGTPRADTTVILVGRGSSDPDANAEVAKVARLVFELGGFAAVEPAYVSLTEPGVPAALDRVAALGASRVVVAPYLLFPGVLADRIAERAAHWSRARSEPIPIAVAGVIGDCDELAELVAERYDEALRGDIRMNCDTCWHRAPLAGHRHDSRHDHH